MILLDTVPYVHMYVRHNACVRASLCLIVAMEWQCVLLAVQWLQLCGNVFESVNKSIDFTFCTSNKIEEGILVCLYTSVKQMTACKWESMFFNVHTCLTYL